MESINRHGLQSLCVHCIQVAEKSKELSQKYETRIVRQDEELRLLNVVRDTSQVIAEIRHRPNIFAHEDGIRKTAALDPFNKSKGSDCKHPDPNMRRCLSKDSLLQFQMQQQGTIREQQTQICRLQQSSTYAMEKNDLAIQEATYLASMEMGPCHDRLSITTNKNIPHEYEMYARNENVRHIHSITDNLSDERNQDQGIDGESKAMSTMCTQDLDELHKLKQMVVDLETANESVSYKTVSVL